MCDADWRENKFNDPPNCGFWFFVGKSLHNILIECINLDSLEKISDLLDFFLGCILFWSGEWGKSSDGPKFGFGTLGRMTQNVEKF
jgi:hypothetical protein